MRASTLGRVAAFRRRGVGVSRGSRSLFGFGGSDSDEAAVPTDGVVEFLSTADVGYWPSHMAVRVFEQVHMASGTEWWVTIAATTVALRCVLFPLTVKLMRGSAKMAACKPEIDALAAQAKERGTSVDQKRTLEVYRKHGVNPLATIALPFLQMPFFISCFFGTRQLCDYYDITAGGTSFFLDLSTTDPTHALPILAGATFLATIELGGEQPASADQAGHMKWIMRGLALSFIPIAWSMPCAVLVYWNVNNGLSLLQALVLKVPGVKPALGIAPAIDTPHITQRSEQPQTYAKPPSQRDIAAEEEVVLEEEEGEEEEEEEEAAEDDVKDAVFGGKAGSSPTNKGAKAPKFKKKKGKRKGKRR